LTAKFRIAQTFCLATAYIMNTIAKWDINY